MPQQPPDILPLLMLVALLVLIPTLVVISGVGIGLGLFRLFNGKDDPKH